MVQADQFLEQIRRFDGEFAAPFCVPFGAALAELVLRDHAVEDDWHLWAGGEAAFVGLKRGGIIYLI